MNRAGKTTVIGLLVLLLAGALLVASFPLQWWNISLGDLRATYRRPASEFVTLDGVEIHYQDQGKPDGTPVVLLHGNFASLRSYDDWLPLIGDRYRVIRFDSPLSGLSGADPTGDYSIDRRIYLMEQLLDHLRVERYFLVATSFNAPTAFRVAADKPQSVLGLVLGNAGGLPRAPDSQLNRPPQNPVTRWLRQYYFPRSFFEKRLVTLLPDPRRRSDEIIDEFHLMVSAEGRPTTGAEILRQFDSQDAQSYLERITVPVLLQWTTEGSQPLLVDRDLVRYQAWLTKAPVRTIEYPDAGHMLYQNAPVETGSDARRFFDAVLAGTFAATGHATQYRFIDGAGGLPIAVAEWGDAGAPDVLLLHGAGFAKEYWLDQRSPGSDACARYVAMDLRGHGASGKPWTAEQVLDSQLWATDVRAVIASLEMRDVLLVGWSYGGYVAMDYLRHFGTENLAGILLVGSAAGLVPPPEFGEEIPDGFMEATRQRLSPDIRQNLQGSRYLADLMTETDLPVATREQWTAQMIASPVYFRKIMSQRGLDNADLVPKLDLPVGFFLGAKDLSVSREGIEALVSTELPSVQLAVAPAAGHAVSEDDPAGFYAALLSMLPSDRVPAACAPR